jgi:glycosyl transferase family 25
MIKTYIINLEKDKERYKNITKLLENSNLDIYKFDAIYGKELSENEINSNVSNICSTILCNYGIIGCAISHIKLWKQLLNEKDDYFLIFEDDIKKINFTQLYKLINNLHTFDWDIINLYSIISINKKIIKNIDDIQIIDTSIPLTLCGYLVNKKFLKKITNYFETNKIIWHIDSYLIYLKYKLNLKYYNLNTNIVEPSKNNSSINSTNNNLTKKILKKLGYDNFVWYISTPILSIKLKYPISIYHFFWILLFIINIKYFKNIWLFFYLIIDLILLYK